MFNKFGESIKAIRSDYGGEFDSQACHTWYSAQGITFEPSAPYAHQQNGISERSNRYILEKSCTILLKSGLPKYLWAEAASTAVYLANRSPTRGLDRAITPFKAWNGLGNQPDLSYLHVFGCQAYYVDEFAKSKGKMAPRSLKAWFIGYEPGSYRLWLPETRRVITRRDVVFDNSTFCNSTPSEPLEEEEENELSWTYLDLSSKESPTYSTTSMLKQSATD